MMAEPRHAAAGRTTPSTRWRSPRARRWWRLASTALALVLAGGCTPTLDWRTVSLPDGGLFAEMPCRPGRFQREVVVGGTAMRLFMLSCEAGGVTYGVATADVGDPTRVEPVLAALRTAAAAAIRARPETPEPLDLPGATPFRGNAAVWLQGVRPDGQPARESLQLFGRGTRVFEASAIGRTLADAAVGPFRGGLRFQLEKPVADPM